MLPPRLMEIKDKLEAKPYQSRKTTENELLAELKVLDQSSELRDFLVKESRVMKMTSGPAGSCPCCGR